MKLDIDSCLFKDINKFNQLHSDFNYHAPEILQNEKDYTEKCDLWNIGVLIYILIFREHPFPGDTQVEVLNQILSSVDNLRNIDNSLLDELIKGLLVIDPKKRLTWTQYLNHSFFHSNYIYSEGSQYDDAMKLKKYKKIMKTKIKKIILLKKNIETIISIKINSLYLKNIYIILLKLK